MDKQSILQYLNYQLRVPYGQMSLQCIQMMTKHVNTTSTVSITEVELRKAAMNSSSETMEKYKTGMLNSMVRHNNIDVLTNGTSVINGIEFKQIIRYV